MLYLVYLNDIPDSGEIRARLLDEHMEHIGGYLAKIRLGGPLLREGSENPEGAILVVEAESADEIRTMIESADWNDVFAGDRPMTLLI